MMSRVRGRLNFSKRIINLDFTIKKAKKRAHLGSPVKPEWRSENQRAAISTHNNSEQFGIPLARIGLGEDLERFMYKKNNE